MTDVLEGDPVLRTTDLETFLRNNPPTSTLVAMRPGSAEVSEDTALVR